MTFARYLDNAFGLVRVGQALICLHYRIQEAKVEGGLQRNRSFLVFQRRTNARGPTIRLSIFQRIHIPHLGRFLHGDASTPFIPNLNRRDHDVALSSVNVSATSGVCVLFRAHGLFVFCVSCG